MKQTIPKPDRVDMLREVARHVVLDFLLLVLLLIVVGSAMGSPAIAVKTSTYSLSAVNLAVVINDADPASVEVGEYYRMARHIPAANMVHVRIEGSAKVLSAEAFEHLKQSIESQLAPDIEAIALVWTIPYAVECNSITSALTLGFDAKLCRHSCAPSKASAYFDSASSNPEADFHMRLSMLLPIESVAKAEALIDRGVASHPVPASAYLLSTSDAARNVRARFYPPSGRFTQKFFSIYSIKSDVLENVDDVMFYFTGLPSVGKLDTVHFVAGALADHLTSTGGDLLGTDQMSSLRWLDAGATASYGTVSEPCNYPQKFPQPSVLMKHYLSGATAIEAYWKSVAWPLQGVFIGEPLAAPYK